MVVNKEKKADIFADFHLDEGVTDNEESLNQLVEREQKSVLSPADRDAFAEFDLDKIVRETEERLRKQQIEIDDDDDDDGLIRPSSRGWESARAATSSLRGLAALRRPPQFLSQRPVTKDNGDIPSFRNLSSQLRKDDTDRSVVLGADSGPAVPKIKPKITPKKPSNATPLSKKKKPANASRSGSTITTSIEEEDEMESDNDEDSLSDDDDVEKGGNRDDDDDDDDDSLIVVRRGKKRKEKDVITRSSTGMPIGGMLTSSTKKRASTSADPSDYRWISPHEADNIFKDFDIDTIVKDYEQYHRKATFGVNTKTRNGVDNDEDDDEDDEQVLGIKKRYRNIKTFWLDNFPRTHAILFRIAIPLALIMFITWFLGIQLAHFEKGEEIKTNNDIIKNMYNFTDFQEPELQFVADGPGACFDHYMTLKVPEYEKQYNKTDLNGLDFPPISLGIGKAEDLVGELESYMRNCTNHVNAALEEYKKYKQREIKVVSQSSLTFNWIRCWDEDELGSNVDPFFPSQAQKDAAIRQPTFFYDTWQNNRTALYKKYLAENYTETEAESKSIDEASGAGMCSINKSASAWFWFVFMTTVGYGNVSPITFEGRLFVALIGWITVIIWAVILYIAGRVLGIIFDDIFRRLGCRKLTGNVPSVIFWGTLSILYVIFLGEYYAMWYNNRAHPGRVRFTPFGLTRMKAGNEGDLLDVQDAYWFSYISLLTVGLGDFSIGPESFFVNDLFGWTAAFLTGFTLIATFLGQIADLVNALIPESGDNLRERLLNTSLVGKKEIEYKRENQKGVEKLERIIEIMDDDDAERLAQRVTRIRVKQNLLVHLLHQTKLELDHYQKRGERYENLSYAMVCLEEDMLSEVSITTRKEREKLESYRDGSAHTALPTPGSEHSYFDDGTPLDLLAKKLKLREGQKDAKKTLKASWYV